MTIDVSLIPQNRVENLISKLSEIENNIGNIGTDITNNVVHRIGDETISGEKTFQNNITAPNQIDYTNITNCITYIPQDIKLELNNGTLTLKAGSKVYVPNGKNSDGSNRFDEVIINRNINYTAGYNDTRMLFVQGSNHSGMDGFPVSQCYSGDTAPTGSTYMYWYDTANNIIKRTGTSGSAWDSNDYSLPICIITGGRSAVTSIDRVFKGFGYIGSTIFALPGVKGLIPNGRNADGSLKNIEFTVSKVITITYNNQTYGTFSLCIAVDNTFQWYPNLILKTNNYLYNGDKYLGADKIVVGKFIINSSSDNGKITSFTPKTSFHALDYNDFSDLKNTVDTNDSNVVHKTGNETITGVKTFNDSNVITNKEFISLTSSPYGQFRAIDGNYGFFIRNDGVSTYFLLTNSNDQYGSWNSLRPLTIENANGKVRINNSVVSGFVKETWKSGTSWYRIWSDGWIEQGGYLSWNGAWTTLTFNRPFTTTNYYINGGGYRSDSSPYQCMIDFKDWKTSSCSVWSSDDNTSNSCVMKWYACGY